MDLDGIPQLQDERKFDDTLGALLIGGLLTMAMWGFLCSQTFTFFKQNTKNGLIVKLVVFFLWALEALHSGLVMHLLYIYLVSNYLNPTVLSYSSWCLSVLAAITTLSNFIVRSMFTWRYYRLTRETPFTLFISALSATDVVTRLRAWLGILVIFRNVSIDTRTPGFVLHRFCKQRLQQFQPVSWIVDGISTFANGAQQDGCNDQLSDCLFSGYRTSCSYR